MYRWAMPAAASRRCLLSPCIPAPILHPLPLPPRLVPVGPDRTTRLNAVPQVLAGPGPAPRIRRRASAHAAAIGLATKRGDGSDKRTAQRIGPATRHGARRIARTVMPNFKLNVQNVRLIANAPSQTTRRPRAGPAGRLVEQDPTPLGRGTLVRGQLVRRDRWRRRRCLAEFSPLLETYSIPRDMWAKEFFLKLSDKTRKWCAAQFQHHHSGEFPSWNILCSALIKEYSQRYQAAPVLQALQSATRQPGSTGGRAGTPPPPPGRVQPRYPGAAGLSTTKSAVVGRTVTVGVPCQRH